MNSHAHGELRPALESDLDALIELGRRSWLSAFALTAPFELIAWWVRMDRITGLYRQHWPQMLVLEDAGCIVGVVQPKDDEINGLWVHPDRQGTGAGTILLLAGEARIQAAGHGVAWLTCSGLNRKAYDFYRRRGYVETQREQELHASGFLLESIRMERVLLANPG